MTDQEFSVQLCQVGPPETESVAEQRDAMARAVRNADVDVDLVVFPELTVTGYHVFDRLPGAAESVPGPSTDALGSAAVARQTNVLFGLPVSRDGDVYNAAVWLGRDGSVAAVHEKYHLWGEEHEHFTAGDRYTVVDTEFGRVGVQICYEANFPEASLALAMREVDAIVNISAWSERMEPDWHTLLPTRALENGAYVVGGNFAGPGRDTTFCGRSKVVGPDGQVVEELGTQPDACTVSLKRAALEAEHERNPMRDDRAADPLEALRERIEASRNDYRAGRDTPDP